MYVNEEQHFPTDPTIQISPYGSTIINQNIIRRCSAPPRDKGPSAAEAFHSRLSKALALSIAYSANTGGIATLTGSPPNLVFKAVVDE